MADAPDPLGKRALYWAPAERREEGPRYPDEDAVPGKYALYSDTGPSVTAPAGRTDSPLTDDAASGRAGHPSNSRRQGGGPHPTVAEPGGDRRPAPGPDELERPGGSGMFGSLALHCSSCRVRSQVDLLEYVVLHLPIWLWRPGRGYTRFMTCPACRRRTWVSATWTSWSR